MKQLAIMPVDLATRIHRKGYVPVQCDCGETFAWDPNEHGRTAYCPSCRRSGDPVLETIAEQPPPAPQQKPAPRPAPPQRIPGMPTRAEFEALPAFAKQSLTNAAAMMLKAKTRLGASEKQFAEKMQHVHAVADMYDKAGADIDAMMHELGGNGGPPLTESPSSSTPSSAPAAV